MPTQESGRSSEPQLPSPNRVFKIKHWAALCGLSLNQAKKIIREGKGPRVVQLSERRIGISERDHEAWIASRTRSIVEIIALVVVLVALAAPAICEPAATDDSYAGCVLALGGTGAFTADELKADATACLVIANDVFAAASRLGGVENNTKLRSAICVSMMKDIWSRQHGKADQKTMPTMQFAVGCSMMFAGVS
jgi:predicted DNA-binding transcriptional regulator AlpA